MENLNKYVATYKEQLIKGDILIAYKELVKFVMRLRIAFMKSLADQYSFAGILHGYLDYTYFYFSNDILKSRKLKFALVLNHLDMRFEIWLLGNTLPIQEKYWELLKATKWNKDRTEMPKYSILECIVVEKPNFNNLELLANQIEKGTIQISDEIIEHLSSVE